MAYLHGSSSGSFMKLQSSEGVIRAAESVSHITQSQAYWQDAVIPCLMSLSPELLEYIRDMAVGFLQE